MNYLVISDELILSSLSPELRKVYDTYTNSLKERTAFDELLAKLNSNRMSRVWYDDECMKLCKTVKNMTYDKRRGHFNVRPTIDKKRVYLGASSNFDEACSFISEYIKERMKLESVN